MLIIASSRSLIPIKLPSQFGEQTILAIAFYMSGFLFRKLNLQPKHIGIWGIIFYLVPAATALYAQFSMTSDTGMSVYPLYAVAMFGTIATLFCSSALAKTRIASILSYIGNKTLYILIFHFLAFKSVSYRFIKINGASVSDLSQFPVLENAPGWMWVVYTFSGVCLSLLAWELFHLPCWQKIKIKRN